MNEVERIVKEEEEIMERIKKIERKQESEGKYINLNLSAKIEKEKEDKNIVSAKSLKDSN